MTDNPTHECRQGRRCKARVRHNDETWHGAGVDRPNRLCRACEDTAFAAIRKLDDIAAAVWCARNALLRSHVSGPHAASSGTPSIPINLPFDTFMTAYTEETTRWERRLPGPLEANLGTLVDLPPTLHTVWLPHYDGGDHFLRTTLDGVDAVLRLSALHERGTRLLGFEERDATLNNEVCHMCGTAALTINPRTDLITCRACRNVWHQDAYIALQDPLAAA